MADRGEDRIRRLNRIKDAIDVESDLNLTDGERKEKTELLAAAAMMLEPQRTMYGIAQVLTAEYGISQRQAYRRIEDVPFVIGQVLGTTDRSWAKLKAKQRAEAALLMANSQQNVDAMLAANAQLIKLDGLDREDMSRIDPTLLDPHIYKLALDTAQRRWLNRQMANGVIDLGELVAKDPIMKVADFEDVISEEQEVDIDEDLDASEEPGKQRQLPPARG